MRPPSHHIHTVASFAELVATPFLGEVNALCWPRSLAGDFAEVIAQLSPGAGITPLDDDELAALVLSPEGALARDQMLADQALLRARGLDPVLDCITGYRSDATEGPVSTDVYSFHADSAPVEADTWLCTYAGSPSQGLPNGMAVRRVDVPETRAALLKHYGGADAEGFAAYLAEQCFDLHYAACAGAVPYSFGTGNLWRIAIRYPGCPVAPCIHRAPPMPEGAPPRLLLIS